MADDNVSMDAQVNVTQTRVLTRDDELRLFALQMATKDTFRFEKAAAEEARDRTLTDARAYHAFLTEGSAKAVGDDA
jgi:hypothetical protein